MGRAAQVLSGCFEPDTGEKPNHGWPESRVLNQRSTEMNQALSSILESACSGSKKSLKRKTEAGVGGRNVDQKISGWKRQGSS
jgi:hypothetical protein